MFIDASAFCAILLREPEREAFQRRIAIDPDPKTSPIAVWETVRALTRSTDGDVRMATAAVQNFIKGADIVIVGIGEHQQALALQAFDRFGKGRHAAQLNMGDCFAYACAKSLGQPLLFKGGDFSRTDIEPAFVG